MYNQIDFINCDIQYIPHNHFRLLFNDTSRNKSSIEEWIEGKQKALYDSMLFRTAFPYIRLTFPSVNLCFINVASKSSMDIYTCKNYDEVALGLHDEDFINAVGGKYAPFDNGIYQVDTPLCKRLKDNEYTALKIINRKIIENESIALLKELGLSSNEANLLFYLLKSSEHDPRNIVKYTPQLVDITRLESQRDEDVIRAALEELIAKELVYIFGAALKGGAKYHIVDLYKPNSGLYKLDNTLSDEQKREKITLLLELWEKYSHPNSLIDKEKSN